MSVVRYPSPAARPGGTAPAIRLGSCYSPWVGVAEVGVSATVHVCGAAWIAGRHLAGSELAHCVSGVADGAAGDERLAALLDLCRQLSGSWVFVVRWADGEVLAAVDRLRSMPLFYGYPTDKHLAIACNAEDLADCLDARSVDDEAARELLLSGYVMGSRTVFRGIHQFQPGEVLYWRHGTAGLHRHYRFLRTDVSDTGPESLTRVLGATMDEVFARLVRQFAGRRIVVPLSGGLDSRLILAMLKRHGHRDLVALTYGRPASREAAISRAVADALGVPWTCVPYEDGAWHPLVASPSMRIFWQRAGQGASLPYLQDYLALHQLRRLDPGLEAVFLPGYVGDMIAGAWTPSSSLVHQSWAGEPSRHLTDGRGPVDVDAVCDWVIASKYNFWPANGAEVGRLRKRMQLFFAEVPFTDSHNSASAFDLFEFENRQARYLANGVRSLEHHGFGWWLPLCDSALMDFFLRVPTDLREFKRLYARWMRDHVFTGSMSRLADIPPIGEGRYAWLGEPQRPRFVGMAHRARAVADRFRSVEPRVLRRRRLGRSLQRFSPPDLRFDEWFARDAAQSRAVRLGDLVRAGDGPFAGLPGDMRDRMRWYEEYPVCLVYPLALLSAAYLSDLYRSARGQGRDQSLDA